MESLSMLGLILIAINFIFMMINCFLIGFTYNKVKSIPTEREIVKGILDSKVPVQLPQNMIPPIPTNINPDNITEKPANYFG